MTSTAFRRNKLIIQARDLPWYRRRGRSRLGERTYQILKRTIDLGLSLLSMPIALPIIGLCAIAIKLTDPGPAFYKQERTGRGGHRFVLYKLRTMVNNADEMKEELQHLNEMSYPDFKITDDPRVTVLGGFLRRTSLDELPQLICVLRGDMSLVGPRPTSFSANTYDLWQTARLEIKPGLTGLWQISGRNDLDFSDRLRLDIAYIRYKSLTLDLEILFRTITAVILGRGAH